MIKIRCPHCHIILQAEENQAGEQKRCPSCQRLIFIPDVSHLTARERMEPIRPEEIPDVSPSVSGVTPRKISLVQRFGNLSVLSRVTIVLVVLVLPVGGLITSRLVTRHLELTKPPPVPTPTPVSARSILRPTADAAVLALVQAPDWKARQSCVEALTNLGPDAVDSVQAALKDGHVMDKFGRRLDLSTAQQADLLTVLLSWSKRQRLPEPLLTQLHSHLNQPQLRSMAALVLAYQQDKAAAPTLSQDLVALVKRIAFVQNRVKEGLEPGQRDAEVLLNADKRQLQDIRSALVHLGPESWPALLQPFWRTWPWIGNHQGEYYLAELDHIRTNPFSNAARLRARLNDMVKNAPPEQALPAATYIARFEGPAYDRNRELASWLIKWLNARDPLVVQRTVWVMSRLVNREFYKFDDSQLPLQASEEAIQACRSWAADSFGILLDKSAPAP